MDTDATPPPEFVEADLRAELASLGSMLGDTRVRYRHGQTQIVSAQALIEVDLEIRNALAQPLSKALQLDVRRLSARLRALDPH